MHRQTWRGASSTRQPGNGIGGGESTALRGLHTTDAVDYNNATGNVSLTVNKATPIVTWATPVAITYGTALGKAQLNARANVEGSFVYTPAPGTVLGTGSQLLSVAFTPITQPISPPRQGTSLSRLGPRQPITCCQHRPVRSIRGKCHFHGNCIVRCGRPDGQRFLP